LYDGSWKDRGSESVNTGVVFTAAAAMALLDGRLGGTTTTFFLLRVQTLGGHHCWSTVHTLTCTSSVQWLTQMCLGRKFYL